MILVKVLEEQMELELWLEREHVRMERELWMEREHVRMEREHVRMEHVWMEQGEWGEQEVEWIMEQKREQEVEWIGMEQKREAKRGEGDREERLQEQERRVAKRLIRRLRKLLARLEDVITRDVLLTKSSHSLLLAMLLFALFLELLGWFILTGLFITFLVYLLLIIHPAFVSVKNMKPEVILKRTATQLSASSNYPLPCKEEGQEIMTSPFWQRNTRETRKLICQGRYVAPYANSVAPARHRGSQMFSISDVVEQRL